MGAKQAGDAQAAEAERAAEMRDWQVKQMDIKAKEEKAAGQRDKFEIDRRTAEAQSALQARGAGSGLDTDLDLIEDLEKRGGYMADMAYYGGLVGERDADQQGIAWSAEANNLRASAPIHRRAGMMNAAGSVLGGISSMARYRV
jgi:hypothetical protein